MLEFFFECLGWTMDVAYTGLSAFVLLFSLVISSMVGFEAF